MPKQAEFVTDDTGAKVLKTQGVPYIRYTPWEPTPDYDTRTLTDRLTVLESKTAEMTDAIVKDAQVLANMVTALERRIAHLESIVHKYINQDGTL